MPRRLLPAGLLLVGLWTISSPASSRAAERQAGARRGGPGGLWAGTLSFRGDEWPVRLHLGRPLDGCPARLDLPALVLAREPVAAECGGGGVAVEIPFGLGTFELERRGDGALEGRRVLAGDTAVLRLARDREPAPREVELTVESDGLRLPAELLVPPGAGPHPAVVLLHGSTPMGREDWEYRSWADLFARRGVAALYYDRRDLVVRGQGGEGEPPSFDELAGDALAAVEALRSRPEIDARRIGLSGGSQAGWVALTAASRSDGVAFLVLRSAPAVTPAQQEEQSVVHRLRRQGLEEGDVEAARAHTRLFFRLVRTGRGWDELAASLEEGREAGWADAVQQPRTPADLSWWRRHLDVDPLPLVRGLDVPALLLYGEEDPVVPPALNAPLFRAAVPGTSRLQVEVFPHADHGLEIGAGRAEGDRWRFPHRPDRMFEVLDRWLREHVTGGSRSEAAGVFAEHLGRLVPALLDDTGVPGAAVGVVLDGRTAWLGGFGVAGRDDGSPVEPSTVFNAGSISKTLTAWGVMRLVEEGRVELDAPVNRYLERWRVRSDSYPADRVTVRRLLAHTAGLSLEAVPEVGPGEPVPSLVEALSDPDDGPRLVAPPGSGYRYSGGGYMVLQLLVEEVTGRGFAAYMRDRILRPLGMEDSGFGWPDPLRGRAASPHEEGEPVPFFRYAGQAAASLATTAGDLARLAAAGVGGGGDAPGGGLLRPETAALMLTPQPDTEQFGGAITNGLGYALWRLADGSWSAGHAGQNTGWGGVVWAVPGTGDGLVVLTNASEGRAAWRWVLCDWATWVADTRWRGLCTGRPAGLPAPPAPRTGPVGGAPAPGGSPAVDSILAEEVAPDEPGAAVVVRRAGRVVHATGYGRTAPDSGAALGADTPFYLASLAKPFTAVAVLQLAEAGELELDDPVGSHVPGLPKTARDATLRQLLTHTSGIPDYYGFIEWSRSRGLDNAGVLDTLRRRGAPSFPPGSRHAYSNSNYVLLAETVRRTADRTLEDQLRREVFGPAGMRTALLLDGPGDSVPGRALGWAPDGDGGFRLVDYRAVDVGGREAPLRLTTVGAGGMVSSARDVDRWAESFFSGELTGDTLVVEATRARTAVEPSGSTVPELRGYGYGWYVSRRYGTDVVWHDGDFVGFHAILLRAPAYGFTLTLLANRADLDPRELAVRIADRLLAARGDGA